MRYAWQGLAMLSYEVSHDQRAHNHAPFTRIASDYCSQAVTLNLMQGSSTSTVRLAAYDPLGISAKSVTVVAVDTDRKAIRVGLRGRHFDVSEHRWLNCSIGGLSTLLKRQDTVVDLSEVMTRQK